VVKSAEGVFFGLYNALELNATIHPLLILEAPIAANIPLLREILTPIFEKGLPLLVLFMRINDLRFFIRSVISS